MNIKPTKASRYGFLIKAVTIVPTTINAMEMITGTIPKSSSIPKSAG